MFLGNHSTGNDESIITKHLIKKVYVLLIVGSAELLYIVEYHLTSPKVCEFKVALYDIHV